MSRTEGVVAKNVWVAHEHNNDSRIPFSLKGDTRRYSPLMVIKTGGILWGPQNKNTGK